jgi:hypothetical protein
MTEWGSRTRLRNAENLKNKFLTNMTGAAISANWIKRRVRDWQGPNSAYLEKTWWGQAFLWLKQLQHSVIHRFPDIVESLQALEYRKHLELYFWPPQSRFGRILSCPDLTGHNPR